MFTHLIGNQHVKDILRRMLEAGRMPGALLFAGEEGVGKKLFALELAKALNCRDPQGVEACDNCPSCVRINKSTFPAYSSDDENKKKIFWSEHTDVALLRPHGRLIRVDPIREIEREANFRPYEGRARIFIIEDADKMNEQSSNALLKTLEEPPATTHLILITARPAALITTILSRCQMIRFAPLAASEIEDYLKRNKKKVSATDVLLLAHAARGSIGRALSLDVESYREQREAMMNVLEALAVTGDRVRLLRASEEMMDAKRKEEYEPRLEMLETLIHDVWSLALGAGEEKIVNEDLRTELAKIVMRVEGRRAARWLVKIEEHRRGFEVNINRKVATDALFLSMAEA